MMFHEYIVILLSFYRGHICSSIIVPCLLKINNCSWVSGMKCFLRREEKKYVFHFQKFTLKLLCMITNRSYIKKTYEWIWRVEKGNTTTDELWVGCKIITGHPLLLYTYTHSKWWIPYRNGYIINAWQKWNLLLSTFFVISEQKYTQLPCA